MNVIFDCRINSPSLQIHGLSDLHSCGFVSFKSLSDNMTYATVRPLLVDVQTNLTNVDLAILLVQDIVADVKFLQQGFDKVQS